MLIVMVRLFVIPPDDSDSITAGFCLPRKPLGGEQDSGVRFFFLELTCDPYESRKPATSNQAEKEQPSAHGFGYLCYSSHLLGYR